MRLVHCQVPLEVSRELGVGEGGCHSNRWVPVCSAPRELVSKGVGQRSFSLQGSPTAREAADLL